MPADNYTYLSLIYSDMMRSINYESWAGYIYQISEEIERSDLTALELACGLGTVAQNLVGKFKKLVITDISLSMLKSAQSKMLDKVCCDMCALPFKSEFDFIYSTFDSVNYLGTKTKIEKMLNSVSAVLAKDGIYTFDVSLEKNSIKYARFLNRRGKVNGIKYRQRSQYDRERRIHYNIFEIILSDGRKVEEVHKQKIYPFEEYFKIIENSNLYVYKCYETFMFDNAKPDSERAQFVLKKKK
jgi:ubiquinone/menaquinone biosynthesis C-methylase UbiE